MFNHSRFARIIFVDCMRESSERNVGADSKKMSPKQPVLIFFAQNFI